MNTKLCNTCGEEKPNTEFSRGKGKLCKVCSLERVKEWGREHPHSARYSHLKARAKKKGIDFTLSSQEFVDWYDTLKTEDDIPTCFYCGRQLDFDNKHSLQGASIDRFDPTIGYTPNNMIMSCLRCNVIKGNWFDPMEMLEIAKKYFSDEDKIL